MKKRKAILVGSADRSKVKKRRRRIGTFTSEAIKLQRENFKAMSTWDKICADVVVQNVNAIAPHRHTIPSPSTSESRVSERAADLGGPLQTQ